MRPKRCDAAKDPHEKVRWSRSEGKRAKKTTNSMKCVGKSVMTSACRDDGRRSPPEIDGASDGTNFGDEIANRRSGRGEPRE